MGAGTGAGATLSPHRSKYRSCSGSSNALYFHRGYHQLKYFKKTEGHALASSVFVGAFGGSVTVKTSFSSNSSQTYEFNRPHMPGYYYYIAGDNDWWTTSSRVFVETAPRNSKMAADLTAGADE